MSHHRSVLRHLLQRLCLKVIRLKPGSKPFTTACAPLRYLSCLFLNTDLLLINISVMHGILIFIVATIAMLIFAAGTQGWFITRSRWYESILLLLVAFTLFRPGFWMDIIHDPYQDVAPSQLMQTLGQVDEGSKLRFASKVKMNWESRMSLWSYYLFLLAMTAKNVSTPLVLL